MSQGNRYTAYCPVCSDTVQVFTDLEYHGERPWTAAQESLSHVEIPPACRAHLTDAQLQALINLALAGEAGAE